MPWWVAAVVGIVVVIVGVIVGATALWWWLPKWQVNRRRFQIRDPKARADVEDNFRKTVGQLITTGVQILTGAAVLVGAGLAYYGTQRNIEASQQAALTSQRAAHDQLISQQVSKGFEQLGSDKIVVRLSGIYALEGVMNTSEQYHQPVLEALCAFVRDSTKTSKGEEPPDTDIQAALTVIGRRAAGPGGINLDGARIPKVNLIGADLTHATLADADLIDANLIHTKLTGRNVSQSQLDAACGGADTKLPSGLTLKPCH